ncbi:hypothetical protein OEZ86_014631 [Tetradesmus obliquus]|nr:hypothetical protein OEZ86_014631 [Tetradesmus obliquus]
MNVLAVMHQPRVSIFRMFNSCLLLSNSGRVVYDGPQQLVLAYMESLSFACPEGENVADFLLDVTAGTVSCRGNPDFQHRGSNNLAALQQSVGSASLLPAAAGSAPVVLPEWTWKPRLLEGLQQRFSSMAKTCDETSGGSIDGCANEHNSSSNSEPVKQPVLSYKAFRKFWETRMLRKQEDAQKYADAVTNLCEAFKMRCPQDTITLHDFSEFAKQHMLASGIVPAASAAAAAAAAGVLSRADRGI